MSVSPLLAEAYRRAPAPLTPLGLRDSFLALVEHVLNGGRSVPFSTAADEDVLSHPATAGFVKELFNSYFRDELYGRYRDHSHVIFSSGSPHEPTFPLPDSLKSCVHMALDRDWYGYSDSRGRIASRQAVAALESQRVVGANFSAANVALTLGGTFAAGCLFDFLLSGRHPSSEPALCAVPNYAPLVSSLANRAPVRLVETPTVEGFTDLSGLLEAVNPNTPLVFLQTVTNPTGIRVRAGQLAELHRRVTPTTTVVLDEAHDCYGPDWQLPHCLVSDNVIRISSLSKRLSIPGIKLGWIVAAEPVIAEYYEYASTMYGGPPSFFYVLVEVAARFRRWAMRSATELSTEDLQEFEPAYGFDLPQLQAMFDDYVASGQRRHRHIDRLRRRFVQELTQMDHDVTEAQYSVNLAARPPAGEEGWVYYRRLLAGAGVAVFPGILTMSFSEPIVRLTVARADEEITEGLHRMQRLRAG